MSPFPNDTPSTVTPIPFPRPPVSATALPSRRVAVLRDGAEVAFRPVGAADRPALEALYRGLSPEDRRRRFATPTPDLDRRQLAFLLAADGISHVAWGAFHRGRLAAVGRYVRFAGEAAAEVALTVAAPWQGRGLGGLLLEVLAGDAARRGVEVLRYAVAGDNHRAARLLASFGGRFRWSGGLGEGELPVRAFLRGRVGRPRTGRRRVGDGRLNQIAS